MRHTQIYAWRRNPVLLNHFIRIIKILVLNDIEQFSSIEEKLSEYYQIGYIIDDPVSVIEDIEEYLNIFLEQRKYDKKTEFNIKEYIQKKYNEDDECISYDNSPAVFYAFKALNLNEEVVNYES